MRQIAQSTKLNGVSYDLRGELLKQANAMEAEGHRILKLNIGNPAPFGFEAPDSILVEMIKNLPFAQGYSDSKGISSARTAVKQYYELVPSFPEFTIDNVYLGNGVSELITISLQALLNNGDEVLIPAPGYPLWTASVSLAGGKPVHYLCDEDNNWWPDMADVEAKITPNTKALVIINPNNPTGAVYPQHIIEQFAALAREHDLILMSDEIYEKIRYDNVPHIHTAAVAPDVLTLTFNGLSKSYRLAGYRAGWLVITGPKQQARGYLDGLEMLLSMRLCSNVPAQHAIQTALGGYQSINELVLPTGRLHEQREIAWSLLNDIPGVSAVKAQGVLYMFPKLDTDRFGIVDDQQFAIDLLNSEKILVSPGTSFNWHMPDHFRLVTLPRTADLKQAIERIGNFLANYQQVPTVTNFKQRTFNHSTAS